MIRVLHVVPSLYGPDGRLLGGAERYALELARHMADEVPTRLLSFGAADLSQRLGALEVRVMGRPWHVRGQRQNPLARGLLTELFRSRANIVHCHQQHVLATSLTALLCRASARRVFVTDHGGGGLDVSSYVSTDRLFHGHLDQSRFARRVAGREGSRTAHVILGGVSVERFSPAPAPRPAGPVLFVGRLLPHKGVEDLIEALPDDLPLDIMSGLVDVTYYADLRRLARGRRVRFLIGRGDAELVEAYRGALCIVLPSVYRSRFGPETTVPELLGQTLLEGMACGIPAICTDAGAMPEVVEDGVTGFVVPPNDPRALGERIRRLRDHPGEARAMGAAARRRVLERFTWPAVVRRCLEIYADSASGRLRRPE